MVRNMPATASTGRSSGSVIDRKARQADAPSMTAASKGSGGSDSSPASTMSVTIGVHCHTSTSARDGITVSGG